MKKNALVLVLALSLGGACARADGPPSCAPSCAPTCEKERGWSCWFKKKDCVKKECVRVPDTRKKTHTEYRCIEEDICKPRCHLCKLGKCGGGCDNCDTGKCKDCGKVRCRRKLVKKFVTEEQCTTKCIAVVKPECCETACPPAPIPAPAPARTGKTELLPRPPDPVKPMTK
jgi:hypothetical protein